MADSLSLEELKNRLNADLGTYTDRYLSATKEALATQEPTGQDALAQGVTAALPFLAGAFSGKKGLYAGAIGAKTGVDVLSEMQEGQRKRASSIGVAEANIALENAKKIRERLSQLETAQVMEPFKQGLIEDRMINVNAAKPLRGSDKEDPMIKQDIVKEAFQAARNGEEVTPEMYKALNEESLEIQREFRQIQENAGVQQRFTTSKEMKDLETEIPGLVKISDKISSKNADKVRKKYEQTLNLSRIIDGLATSIKKDGNRLVGTAAVRQAQLFADLLRVQKENFGGGAAYTELEEMIANAAIPKLLSNPRASFWDAFKEAAKYDPLERLADLKKGTIEEFKLTIKPWGFAYEKSKPLSFEEFKALSKGEVEKLIGK